MKKERKFKEPSTMTKSERMNLSDAVKRLNGKYGYQFRFNPEQVYNNKKTSNN